MNLGWLRAQSRTLGLNLDAQVELGISPGTAENLLPNSETRRKIISRGTLSHERTHWLHLIGTTSGVFHVVLWETQALVAKRLIEHLRGHINQTSFPLCRLGGENNYLAAVAPQVPGLIRAWIGLRDLHHWFWGNQYVVVTHPPNQLAFEFLSAFLQEWLVKRYPGTSAGSRFDVPPAIGEVSGMADKGKVLGWHDLTECAARLNEYCTMLHHLQSHNSTLHIDPNYLFEDGYGKARTKFYEQTGRTPSQSSEAILAVLVHESMNTSLPPFAPLSVFSEPWISFNPYRRFIHFAEITKAYAPNSDQALDLESFSRIRSDIRAVLLEKKLVLTDAVLCTNAQKVFGGFATFRSPQELYTVSHGRSYPVDEMRYQYLGRLFYDAFGLYGTEPGMLALPALYRILQPKRSQELLDPIRPPILYFENKGYQRSWDDDAAHAVLLLDTVLNEILHTVMSAPYEQLIERLVTSVRHEAHQRFTLDAVQVALLNAGFSEAFAATILGDLKARLEQGEPDRSYVG